MHSQSLRHFSSLILSDPQIHTDGLSIALVLHILYFLSFSDVGLHSTSAIQCHGHFLDLMITHTA